MGRLRRLWGTGLVLLAVPAGAQEAPVGRDTVTVAAGAHYAAGGLHRYLFGRYYRELWTAPIRVPVLDLRAFAGGLTPTTAGGGQQTLSLRFRGADSLNYGFRSVDKDPSVLPPAFRGTFVEDLIQDQTSSAHPAGPALVAPLLDAVGLLRPWRTLVVLPDDPALGEHRPRFKGALGFLSRRAIVEPGVRPFADATEILDSDELFPLLIAGPDNRIDRPAFLLARLFDVYIGDWDRHRGQFGWARLGEDRRAWVPVPEDRDQAFVRFDGLLLQLVRRSAPQLTNFGPQYSGITGATWNGRELDRWLLTPLPWPVWDSVATAMQAALTDSVLRAAVAAMPPEFQAIDGPRMLEALRARRTLLPRMTRAFHDYVVGEAELHGTDAAETATVRREDDGAVTVTLSATGATPYLTRRFSPEETHELRLYLHGGDDRVLVRGAERAGLWLRVVPGPGADEVVNASRPAVLVYSDDGDAVSGAVRLNRRSWDGVRAADGVPHRDWGALWRFVTWAGLGPDVGAFLGAGAYRIGYGFRHDPYATRVRLRGGWATGAGTGRAQLTAEVHRPASRVWGELDVLASGIEVLNFHGFGNGVSADRDDDFYRVNHRVFAVQLATVVPVADQVALRVGSAVQYSGTTGRPDRILGTLPGVYGAGDFGLVRASAELTLDTRDVAPAARRGVHLRLRGAVHPAVLDVVRPFSVVEGSASTYLTLGDAPATPTLALRAGGSAGLGTVPFFAAPTIGGQATVRLGRENRYTGDAAVWSNAELRLDLAGMHLLLPARVGVFGLADAGRVFFDGDPPDEDTIHYAAGGGVWIAWINRTSVLRAAMARSDDDRVGVYIGAGFAY